MDIGRLLTAMVTPFDANGAVDYAQAKRLARALLDSGSEGVVLAGTTGESPTLSSEEKMRLFVEVKEVVGERGAVVAGTGTYDTAESVELSREAEQLGVDAVLLTCPYYSRPTQDGLYRHFETIVTSCECTETLPTARLRPPEVEGPDVVSSDCCQLRRTLVITVILGDHEPAPLSNLLEPDIVVG